MTADGAAAHWPSADGVEALQPGRLSIYLLDATAPGGLESKAELLSRQERRQRDRYHFESDRLRFASTRICLRLLLGELLERPPNDIVFSISEFGKPSVAGTPVQFNVAHSGRFSLLAFTLEAPLGVDIEEIREETVGSGLAGSVFSRLELTLWRDLSADRRAEAFFEIWTRKEALLKGTGVGLSVEPKTLSLALAKEQELEIDFAAPSRWQVLSLEPPAGFAAAVACPAKPMTIECRRVGEGILGP